MTDGRRSAAGLAYSFAGQGGQIAVQLVVFVVLAHLLAPSAFGLVAASLVVMNVAMLVATAGLRTALVQLPTLEEEHLRVALTLQVLLACVVFGSVASAAPTFAGLFRIPELTPVLRAMAAAYLVRCLALGDALLLRRAQLRMLAAIELASYTVGFGGVTLVLAFRGWGVWAVVYGHIAQSLLRTTALWVASRQSPRMGASPGHARDLLRIGIGSTLGQAADIVAWEGDNFVVGRWLGVGALGFYERAYRLMIVPAGLFGLALWNVVFPAMAREQHDVLRLRRIFDLSTTLIAVLTLPAAVLLALLSGELVTLVLGNQWRPLEKVFQILVFALFFRCSFYVTDSLIVATGHVYRHAARRLIFAASVLGGAFLGQRWGLAGVATCVLLALGLNFLIMVRLSLSLIDLSWRQYLRSYLPAAQICAAVAVSAWPATFVLRAVGASSALVAFGGLAAGVLAAMALVRLAAKWGVGRSLLDFVHDLTRIAFPTGPPTWLAVRLMLPQVTT